MNNLIFYAVSELQFLVARNESFCCWLIIMKNARTGNGTSGISPDKNCVRMLKYISCPAFKTDWELTN